LSLRVLSALLVVSICAVPPTAGAQSPSPAAAAQATPAANAARPNPSTTGHEPAPATTAPPALPTRQPYISVPDPRPATNLRERNSVVMDVDFVEQAVASGGDGIDIVGTIQLILDRIASQTAPLNLYGTPRSVLWVPVNGSKECQHSSDAGILEIRVARFVNQTQSFVFIGHQIEEANLSFRIFDCAGSEILSFPSDGSSYAVTRFAPYYFSVTGTAGVLALANAHNNSNNSLASVVGIVNSYGALQANIGAHDTNKARNLALFRMIGNIPGDKVPPPAPGTVSALLQTCAFRIDTDHYIRLHCGNK
jgi:hypothetical protein